MTTCFGGCQRGTRNRRSVRVLARRGEFGVREAGLELREFGSIGERTRDVGVGGYGIAARQRHQCKPRKSPRCEQRQVLGQRERPSKGSFRVIERASGLLCDAEGAQRSRGPAAMADLFRDGQRLVRAGACFVDFAKRGESF